MSLQVDIKTTPTWLKAVPTLPRLTRRCLKATLNYLNWPPAIRAEVSVVFTTDANMQKLNHQWRRKNKPTNVLSFPQLDHIAPHQTMQPLAFGDIVLAFQTIRREAMRDQKKLPAHIAHLLVHGMLHLLGYDHETGPHDARRMEKIECEIMKTLGYENPYRTDHD